MFMEQTEATMTRVDYEAYRLPMGSERTCYGQNKAVIASLGPSWLFDTWFNGQVSCMNYWQKKQRYKRSIILPSHPRRVRSESSKPKDRVCSHPSKVSGSTRHRKCSREAYVFTSVRRQVSTNFTTRHLHDWPTSSRL